MAKAAQIATGYFEALGRQDLDAAVAVWKPGAVDRLVGDRELTAPDGIRAYFGEVFAAFPDFALDPIAPGQGGAPAASLAAEGWLRILPHHAAGGLDGFFIACFQRGA